MFDADSVRQTVSAVAKDLNIDGEKGSISASEAEELISRSIYRCLSSTDFRRSISQTVVANIRKR